MRTVITAYKRKYLEAFIRKCAGVFAPFARPEGVLTTSLLGAADALSDAAVVGDITEEQAKEELHQTILAAVP